MSRILVIEDEMDIADLVALHLRRDGHEAVLAHDGRQGLQVAQEVLPDLVLLDLMLPGMDGVRVFKELRRFPGTRKVPVILLTARAQTEDRVAGLELGADDYVTKPFSPKELLLRIRVALRRQEVAGEASNSLAAGPFRFDLGALVCYMDQVPLELTLIEYKLMLHLCEHAGKPCERTELLRAVWGYSDAANSRTLDTHVKRLRAKLGKHADCIATVRTVGYMMGFNDGP